MRAERRANAVPSIEACAPVATRTVRRVLSSLVSLPILVAILALVSCDPATTRPDVIPLPEARTVEVIGDRTAALEALHHFLVADSIPVARMVARDHWLESPWFDALTLQPVTAHRLGPDVVKLRGWTEPARPGDAIIVVELVYRPLADPSVPHRTLERAVPPTDSIYARVGRVLKQVEDSIGAHVDEGTHR